QQQGGQHARHDRLFIHLHFSCDGHYRYKYILHYLMSPLNFYWTLPWINWLITCSKSSPASVSRIIPPSANFSPAPPGDNSMNFSPMIPRVLIDAIASS